MLLVALGPDRASEVFKHLHYDEIESLSLEMAKMQHVEPATTTKIMEELAATVSAYDSIAAGGVEYAREVLEKAIGTERAAEIIGRLSSVIEMRPFEFLPAPHPSRSSRSCATRRRRPLPWWSPTAHDARGPGAGQPA